MGISKPLALLLLLLPSVSHAWWNDEWSFRKKIQLDTTAATGVGLEGSVTDSSVLIRLHAGNFQYFLDMLGDGADIRFVAADDKTPLKFHIEKFDPINEIALIWVKVPLISAGANAEHIWLYYGNSAAVSGQDIASTYDQYQSLVYHFDDPNGAPLDRSAFANNPLVFSALNNTSSLIGAGATFKGKEYISVADTPSLRISREKGWTFSAWIKMDAPQQDAYVMQFQDAEQSLVLGIKETGIYAQYKNATGEIAETPAAASPLTLGSWQHVTLNVSGDTLNVFLNEALVSSTGVTLGDINGKLSIGAKQLGTGNFFIGEMDEVQVANTARNSDWLKLAASSQGIDSKLAAYGSDEKNEGAGGGESYFKVILKNVTVDGWAVIFILIVMAVISWLVMFVKGVVILRTQRENWNFLQEFAKLDIGSTDKLDVSEENEFADSDFLTALVGKHDHFQGSTLYRIYHMGISETKKRLGATVGAQATGLSTKSFNVVRAAMDAELTREVQRLNRQMVLLTIAISGGPFLGLLGTVIGVMITFAAIAASGDVNVNAIAPGIAAALVATVAGLGVAIPALFGYNYLGSRIKDTITDMHVFVDEFIAKLTEAYGE